MSPPEIWTAVIFFAVCVVSYLIFGSRPSSDLHDTNAGELMPLEHLASRNSLLRGTCHAILIRQSGNVYRDLGVFPSPAAAIAEASKSFRRAGVDTLRVTHSDERSLAAYRSIYNFKGRAEGKKLAGVTLRIIEPEPAQPLDFLEATLREATNTKGTKWQVRFDYRCKKCGGTNIHFPDEKVADSPVHCTACGHVFGTFAEVWAFSNSKAEDHVLSLEAARLLHPNQE